MVKPKNKADKSFLDKAKPILLQVLTITFSISLSIWLNGLSTSRSHLKESHEFLRDVSEDLRQDVKGMEQARKNLSQSQNSIKAFLQENASDTANANIYFISRKTHNGNYEGFKSSGKISFIRNKKIKAKILEYYQENIPKLETIELMNINASKEMGELMFSKKNKKEIFYDNVLFVKVRFFMDSSQEILRTYDSNIAQAKSIMAMIAKETKK